MIDCDEKNTSLDLEMRVCEIKEQAKKMVGEVEALWWENEAIRLKALGSEENKHKGVGEHITESANNDKVN